MSARKPAVREALNIRDKLAKDGARLKDEPSIMSAGHQYGKHLAIMGSYYEDAARNIEHSDPKLAAYYKGHVSAYRDMYQVFEELLQLDVLSEIRADEIMKKVLFAQFGG